MGLGGHIFRPNDLDEVYYGFFDRIWETGRAYADPSGWTDTFAASALLAPSVTVPNDALGRYYLDEGRNLGSAKDAIARLMGEWEAVDLDNSEFTLYSSVSVATAAVLLALKRRGIAQVIFETPAYSVTVNQAREFNLDYRLLPSYRRDNFDVLEQLTLHAEGAGPRAVWMTHPRVSLGLDQNAEALGALDFLGTSDFLIVDEATEQNFPSVLGRLQRVESRYSIIRIRGLLKGAGLNGVRIAAAFHPSAFREDLEDTQGILGASLDAWSLGVAVALASEPERLKTILETARLQAVKLREKVARITSGTAMEPSRLVNGYMGSLFVKLADDLKSFDAARERMLRVLRVKRVPVILGSTMLFAFDPPWEQIRLNYFNREFHLLRLVEVLSALHVGRLD